MVFPFRQVADGYALCIFVLEVWRCPGNFNTQTVSVVSLFRYCVCVLALAADKESVRKAQDKLEEPRTAPGEANRIVRVLPSSKLGSKRHGREKPK